MGDIEAGSGSKMNEQLPVIGLAVVVGVIEAAVIGNLVYRKLKGKTLGTKDSPL